MSYDSPKEIMDEIASLTPSYGGIRYSRLEGRGLQWPCPDADHPGTSYLHKGQFYEGQGAGSMSRRMRRLPSCPTRSTPSS